MGICVKVFDKADTDWVTLTLWTDDECPEFCPVCLLLVYIHLTKIQGGFLFPSELELLNPPSDGVFVTQISYGVLQECMTQLVKGVLGLSGLSPKVGLHLLQKTGYLFGIWGDAEVTTLAKSARHKCIDIANVYAQDAAYLKTVSHLQLNNSNCVKKWKSVLQMSPTSAAMLNTESMPFACSVVELAQRFITHHLQVVPTHVFATSPTFLCDKSVKFVRPMQAAERISKLLATMPPAVNAELTMLMAIQLQEGVESVLASRHAGPNIAPVFPVHASVGVTTASNVAPNPKKSCIHRIIHFQEIAKVKAARDPREKVEGILQMAHKMASLETWDVTESTCQFVIKYFKKVHQCFLLHCGTDTDKFLMHYPNFKDTTFKCTCKK
jgi:hypothetical protein